MPTSTRFPPEWPSACPEPVDKALQPAHALRSLRRAIDELHFAYVEKEQDARSHGRNLKKNRATLANHSRLIGEAADALELLRHAREAVERMPTVAYQRTLMRHERQLAALITRFENSFNEPPTRH